MFQFISKFYYQNILHIMPVSDKEWAEIVSSMDYLQKFEDQNRDKLRHLVNNRLLSKVFVTAHNSAVPRKLLISVATQACVVILNLGEDWLKGLATIKYNNHQLLINNTPKLGSEYMSNIGYIIDGLEGEHNGVPPLHTSINKDKWLECFTDAYEDFTFRVSNGPKNEILFNQAGLTDLASFFAIMTEAFFTAPDTIRCSYPDVYQYLTLFYRQNPAIQQNMNTQNSFGALFEK